MIPSFWLFQVIYVFHVIYLVFIVFASLSFYIDLSPPQLNPLFFFFYFSLHITNILIFPSLELLPPAIIPFYF